MADILQIDAGRRARRDRESRDRAAARRARIASWGGPAGIAALLAATLALSLAASLGVAVRPASFLSTVALGVALALVATRCARRAGKEAHPALALMGGLMCGSLLAPVVSWATDGAVRLAATLAG